MAVNMQTNIGGIEGGAVEIDARHQVADDDTVLKVQTDLGRFRISVLGDGRLRVALDGMGEALALEPVATNVIYVGKS